MQVADKSQEEGEKPRKQAIVKVMVDLLLGMEGITEHKGLVCVPESSAEMPPLCKQLVLKAFMIHAGVRWCSHGVNGTSELTSPADVLM